MAQVSTRVLKAASSFVRDVEKTGVRLHGAYLFGSHAAGRARHSSDIDIALISPDFTGWVDDLEKIREATRKMDPRIETFRFRPESFVDENPIAWEVKTKGISLLKSSRLRKSKVAPKQTPRSTKRRSRPV